MLALYFIGSLFIHAAVSQEVLVTCMCGLFIDAQFDQGGGQSKPNPLEYIGTGTDITDPDGTICDNTEPTLCDELCVEVGIVWAENVTTCADYPTEFAHCYNSKYCEVLQSDPRVPDTFSCQELQVRSLIKQCPPESERGDDWSASLDTVPNIELSCTEFQHTCDTSCPSSCDCNCDSATLCQPAGCTVF